MVRKSDEATSRHWCIDLLNCLSIYVNIDFSLRRITWSKRIRKIVKLLSGIFERNGGNIISNILE